MATSTLQAAKYAKNDEFYTHRADIENELKHYKEQFSGKVVYCNCDDPYESNFFQYFAANFNALKLKKLVTTSYTKSPIVGQQLLPFNIEGLKPDGKEPYVTEINEVPDLNLDGAISLEDVKHLLEHDKNVSRRLKGDIEYTAGDFRSKECVALLDLADIVCTNPPFSLFREYVAQLIENGKSFLIIGNDNAIAYKDFFKHIKENKIWMGYSRVKEFKQPDGTTKKFGNVGWYTNLDTTKRHDKITLYKKYTPEEYPRYHNYDAIEVSKVADIPMDYEGEMGVPITFLDKYNPEQFEIIGSSSNLSGPIKTANGLVYRYKDRNGYMRQAANERFALPDGDTWRRIYDRIVIKRKDV